MIDPTEDLKPRDGEWKKRFTQAIDEISDEGVFSADQIVKLNNMIILLKWGVQEAIATRTKGEGQ